MTDITTTMTADHRECDDTFVEFENAIGQKDWPQLNNLWSAFSSQISHHFAMEEDVLFPAFEAATGFNGGPTVVMRSEHQQMRAMMCDIEQALKNEDHEQCQAIAETLMFMMQQHNMKEEQMLYPMADQHTDGQAVVASMQAAA